MKKKILLIMTLFTALTGSYICTTNAARNTEKSKPVYIVKPSDQTVPQGGTIKIEVIVKGTPTPVIRWYKNNRRIYKDNRTTIKNDTTTGKATLTILKAKQDDAGVYEINAENIIGKSDTTCTIHVSKKR